MFRSLANLVAAALALALTSCSVPLSGAPCTSDENCPAGQLCTDGKCSEGTPSNCTSDPACTSAGAAACDPAGSNQLGTCADLGGGCLRLREMKACPSSAQTCPAGKSACLCPASACTPGASRCNNGSLETCQEEAPGGCGTWSAPAACPAHMKCESAEPSARCACDNNPSCAHDGLTFCDPASAGALSTCATDANSCLFATAAACELGKVCVPGTGGASCQCPATGTGLGQGCTGGSTTCDQDRLIRCTSVGGCQKWELKQDCAANGGVCASLTSGQASGCCPTPGNDVGQGCGAANALSCSRDLTQVLSCASDSSGCLVWSAAKSCSNGLVCGSGTSGTTCTCPANTGTDFHADANAPSLPSGALRTGVASPSSCRFTTLSDALAEASRHASSRVVTIGASNVYPGWQALHAYGAGDRITPSSLNGSVYQAQAAGTSGSAEPSFGAGTIADGTVTWAPVASEVHEIFASETFPLRVPNGVTVINNECALNSAVGCDPRAYVVAFNKNAGSAVDVSGGGAVTGLGVAYVGGPTPSPLIHCTSGSATLDRVLAGNPSTTAGVGILASGSCSLQVTRALLGQLTSGLTVNAAGAQATLRESVLWSNLTGVTVTDGAATLDNPSGLQAKRNLLLANTTGMALRSSNSATATPSLNADSAVVLLSVNEGLFVSTLLPSLATATLTNCEILGRDQANNHPANASGVRANAGTVRLTSSVISDAGGPGLFLGTGAKAFLADTLVEKGDGIGVHVVGGALEVSGASHLQQNGFAGLRLESGSASLSGPISVTGNGPGTGILATKYPGIHQVGGTLILTGSSSHSLAISGNGSHGIWTTGGTALTVAGVDISANGSSGISVELGSGQTLTAALSNTLVHGNAAAGISFGGPGKLSESLVGMDVYANDNNVFMATCGGICFVTSSSLSNFDGNSIHGNGGAQVGFSAAPAGGGSWDLRGSGCAGTPNRIYCYSGTLIPISVGVATNGNVDARGVSWANSPPTSGTDFSASKGTVTAIPSCAATVSSCP